MAPPKQVRQPAFDGPIVFYHDDGPAAKQRAREIKGRSYCAHAWKGEPLPCSRIEIMSEVPDWQAERIIGAFSCPIAMEVDALVGEFKPYSATPATVEPGPAVKAAPVAQPTLLEPDAEPTEADMDLEYARLNAEAVGLTSVPTRRQTKPLQPFRNAREVN